MIYRQDLRHLGQQVKNKRNWRNGLMIGSEAAELAGGGIALASPLFGPLAPEALALGSALGSGGKFVNKIARYKLLK